MPDGRVVVTWQDNGGADEFAVLRADNATAVANVGGGATTATVTTVPPGTTTGFVVRASDSGGHTDSQPSNVVTVMGPADPPADVRIDVGGASATSLTV